MPDTVRSLAALQTLLADNTSGDITAQHARDVLVSAYQPAAVTPGGRLTTESGVGVSTADRTAQSTLYYTPHAHNRIGLYDGTSWTLHTFTERSLALSGLTSGKNYDVFLYDNAGTLTLELSAAWTNDTTRADALTTQDGIAVKSGATTRRYLGTIRTTGTTTTEDSASKRFLWNMNNRVLRTFYRHDSTTSWTYGTSTWRQVRATAANQVEAVVGLAGASVLDLYARSYAGGADGYYTTGVGEDSTSAPAADCLPCQGDGRSPGGGIQTTTAVASLTHPAPLGYHYWAWLERGNSGTLTHYGAVNTCKTGMWGTLDG